MVMPFDNIVLRNFTNISDNYLVFAKSKNNCSSCPVFYAYKQVVMSEGNACDPTFMFIGESPGQAEVEEQRPFIGRAGQVLRKELRKYGDVFNRNSVLVTNVLPCRPLDNKFPSNDNDKTVKQCCEKWLYNEIKLVHPKVVILLGNPALKSVRGDWGITKNRGEWKFLPRFKVWTFSTFHPSYVLRCDNDDDKKYIRYQFESDIEKVASEWLSITSIDTRIDM